MKQRIPKSREARLVECETHLYFLWDARRQFHQEYDRYKQLAAELRILVGDHKPARRLLFSMMTQFGFSYEVPPPPPPCDKQAITPMVGWKKTTQNTSPSSVNLKLLMAMKRSSMRF